MRESASNLRSNNISEDRHDPPNPARSYSGMIFSAILPGLGQIYLGRYIKGCIIFFVFASAIALFYLNSYPVKEWRDLIRFGPATQTETSTNDSADADIDSERSIHLWTLDSGKKLMFRPSWILKITASIQAIICWIYAVSDGWRGRRKNGVDNLERI